LSAVWSFARALRDAGRCFFDWNVRVNARDERLLAGDAV
jgi:hypothetical protein